MKNLDSKNDSQNSLCRDLIKTIMYLSVSKITKQTKKEIPKSGEGGGVDKKNN